MVFMEILDQERKSWLLVLLKQTQNFVLSFHYNADNSYLFLNGKEIVKFKDDNKNVNFPTQFCLGSISNGFRNTESREVSLNDNVYDFSVDKSSIDKYDILNITSI